MQFKMTSSHFFQPVTEPWRYLIDRHVTDYHSTDYVTEWISHTADQFHNGSCYSMDYLQDGSFRRSSEFSVVFHKAYLSQNGEISKRIPFTDCGLKGTVTQFFSLCFFIK
jgi:hypothetical protein